MPGLFLRGWGGGVKLIFQFSDNLWIPFFLQGPSNSSSGAMSFLNKFITLPAERDLCLLWANGIYWPFQGFAHVLSWVMVVYFSDMSYFPFRRPKSHRLHLCMLPDTGAVCTQQTFALLLLFSFPLKIYLVGEFQQSFPSFYLAARYFQRSTLLNLSPWNLGWGGKPLHSYATPPTTWMGGIIGIFQIRDTPEIADFGHEDLELKVTICSGVGRSCLGTKTAWEKKKKKAKLSGSGNMGSASLEPNLPLDFSVS